MSHTSMTAPSSALYPPTITPPEVPLPLYRFAWRFLGNPLLAIPQQVYEERFVVLRNPGAPAIAWITAPDLTERVLQNKDNLFVKTPLEKRVFKRSIREGVLTSDGPEWRWQRRVILGVFVLEFDWDGLHMLEPIIRVTLRPKGGMPLQVLPF